MTTELALAGCCGGPRPDSDGTHSDRDDQLGTGNLSGRDFRGRSFDGTNLAGKNLAGANLEGASFIGASLAGANLMGANLRGANLSEVTAHGADFGGTDLTDATLIAAQLTDTTFVSATISGADFSGANLRRARLNKAIARAVIFERADAREASFRDVDVDGSSFRSANLSGATIAYLANFETVDWIDAVLTGVDFRGGYDVRRFAIDENYLFEFRVRSRTNAAVYRLWKLTSDCGRSFGRWLCMSGATVVAFALIYSVIAIDFGPNETALSPIYFSVVTATTLGYGDALPVTITAQLVVMFQVILGYLFLGGLVSILGEKLARRA